MCSWVAARAHGMSALSLDCIYWLAQLRDQHIGERHPMNAFLPMLVVMLRECDLDICLHMRGNPLTLLAGSTLLSCMHKKLLSEWGSLPLLVWSMRSRAGAA